MELTPGWVGTGATVLSLIGGGIAAWLRNVDAAQESRITEVKRTQAALFEKHDHMVQDLQSYKLYVAEKFINREMLREQLAPINKALEKIDTDLREMRKP